MIGRLLLLALVLLAAGAEAAPRTLTVQPIPFRFQNDPAVPLRTPTEIAALIDATLTHTSGTFGDFIVAMSYGTWTYVQRPVVPYVTLPMDRQCLDQTGFLAVQSYAVKAGLLIPSGPDAVIIPYGAGGPTACDKNFAMSAYRIIGIQADAPNHIATLFTWMEGHSPATFFGGGWNFISVTGEGVASLTASERARWGFITAANTRTLAMTELPVTVTINNLEVPATGVQRLRMPFLLPRPLECEVHGQATHGFQGWPRDSLVCHLDGRNTLWDLTPTDPFSAGFAIRPGQSYAAEGFLLSVLTATPDTLTLHVAQGSAPAPITSCPDTTSPDGTRGAFVRDGAGACWSLGSGTGLRDILKNGAPWVGGASELLACSGVVYFYAPPYGYFRPSTTATTNEPVGQAAPCTGGGTPAPVEQCGNGIDDDGDGQIDEGCTPTPTWTPFAPLWQRNSTTQKFRVCDQAEPTRCWEQP